MRQNRPVPFDIVSLDSLGQGVSKSGDKITFIPKTLPGEKGEATILSEKKGVAFARVTSIDKTSPDRIEPVCPHFSRCPSCHYLHATYDRELVAKKEAFQNLFRKLPLPDLKVIPAPRRTGYRNRIQLHYDTKLRKIGMLDARTSEIIPVPSCLIGEEKIAEGLRALYQNDSWLRSAPKNPVRGHVELYLKNGEVHFHWNEMYASGGFTQVFAEMNEKLQVEIKNWFGEEKKNVVDLFAGNGNLSDQLPYSSRLCVDVYNKPKGSDFVSQSLYDKGALAKIRNEIVRRELSDPVVILDPPRSGLSDLSDWLKAISPKKVAYVSCDPHTLVRDLLKVDGYHLSEAVLLDFFPSTFHFESLIFLERK